MKDFTDVTPTEKKRELKIQKEKKLEEESKVRKKKDGVAEEAKPVEKTEVKAGAEVKEEPKEDAKEALKKKEKKKAVPKPVVKVQYTTRKKVVATLPGKKKPKFLRQEHSKHRLDVVWRKSIGIDSKKHEGKRGKGAIPTVGFKKPDEKQGLHPTGFRTVLVHNVKEISVLNPKEEGAIIAASVGRRKRNEMIAEANKLKINILNPRKGET
jgi:large subunit ribosomal protein L32e